MANSDGSVVSPTTQGSHLDNIYVGYCKICNCDFTSEMVEKTDFCPICKADMDSVYRDYTDEEFERANDLEFRNRYADEIFESLEIPTSSTIRIPCPVCNGQTVFGTDRCDSCNVQISTEFWRQLNDMIADGQVEVFEDEYEDEEDVDDWRLYYDHITDFISDYGDEVSICCNQLDSQCDCDVPAYWQDVEGSGLLSAEDKEKAYAYESSCSGCVHYYARTCIPYRAWLYNYYLEVESPGEIDYCHNYIPHPSITTVRINS